MSKENLSIKFPDETPDQRKIRELELELEREKWLYSEFQKDVVIYRKQMTWLMAVIGPAALVLGNVIGRMYFVCN